VQLWRCQQSKTSKTMKPHSPKIAWLLLAGITLIGSSACRSTAQGVVRDTKRNTEKVGEGMEHVGEKIQESTR
jgi:hypothetical protein